MHCDSIQRPNNQCANVMLQVYGSSDPPHQSGSYMFYALEPSSKYEVVIQSQNEWGWSRNSVPFFFVTKSTGEGYNYLQFLCESGIEFYHVAHLLWPSAKLFWDILMDGR